MSRPPSLDLKKKKIICKLIRLGIGRETAARYVGCSTRTILNTAIRDRQFDDMLRQAFAAMEVNQVRVMSGHGRKNWRAAAWLLERRRCAAYARRPEAALSLSEVHALIGRWTDAVSLVVTDPAVRENLLAACKEIALDAQHAQANLYAEPQPPSEKHAAQHPPAPQPKKQPKRESPLARIKRGSGTHE